METLFSPDWKDWLDENVSAGRDKDGIFRILIDEGFDYATVKMEMGYEPSVPLAEIVNPLKAAKSSSKERKCFTGASIDSARIFIPNSQQFGNEKLTVFCVPDFLNEAECETLIPLIREKATPSALVTGGGDNTYRSSKTCYFKSPKNDFVEELDLRICKFLGIDQKFSEPLQGQWYSEGQEFKPHTDFFEQDEIVTQGRSMGQRTYTCMIYLNTVASGGETVFPAIDEIFSPAPGMMVIWNSLTSDGNPNPDSIHQANPVTRGEKFVITKWFRSFGGIDDSLSMYSKTDNELLPNFTRTGFKKEKCPQEIYGKIFAFYRRNFTKAVIEDIPGRFVESRETDGPASELIPLPDDLKQDIHSSLKPLIEDWSGCVIVPTYVYGVRVYRRGATLTSHRDRIKTHILSAIINIDQHVEKDWPLVIEDNFYRRHEVILQPGEIVLYEGARLEHGRPQPFRGEKFANVFCHFKPDA